jgi:hypothetical protein
MSVLKLSFWVDLQQKVGVLVLSITSRPLIIILENKLVYTKNVVMVRPTVTTGIIFLIFTYMHFWVWGILRSLSACAPTAYEVVRDFRKFEKHCL